MATKHDLHFSYDARDLSDLLLHTAFKSFVSNFRTTHVEHSSIDLNLSDNVNVETHRTAAEKFLRGLGFTFPYTHVRATGEQHNDNGGSNCGRVNIGCRHVRKNLLVNLTLDGRRSVWFHVYAESATDTKKYSTLLRNYFGGLADKSCDLVRLRFVQQASQGYTSRSKDLACNAIDEIRANYPTVQAGIDELFGLDAPYEHGKVILWTGPPGNGKTHLIRALVRHWARKHGIEPEVILDPELLFDNTDYMTSVMLNDEVDVPSKFRLLIAEDCASVFSVNCRNRPGFGRMLNAVDGLLGQGQRMIYLLTANEDVGQIDPAILRAGRCLQQLEIPNWSRKHAIAWLEERGAGDKVNQLPDTIALADLYAIVDESKRSVQTQANARLGFQSVT